MKNFLYDWNGLNLIIFKHINELFEGNVFFYKLLPRVSQAANHHILFQLLSSLLILVIFLSYRNRKNNLKEYIINWVIIFVTLVGCFASEAILFKLKSHFALPRPLCIMSEVNIIPDLEYNEDKNLTILKKCNNKTDSSFPSGHSMVAMNFVIILWHRLNFYGKSASILYLLSIGISRIAMGMHYPADVMGGYLLGLIFALTAKKLVNGIVSPLEVNFTR